MKGWNRKKKEKTRWILLIIAGICVITGSWYYTRQKILPADQPKIVVILPGETNDQSWNKANYEGILECQKRCRQDKKINVTLQYQSNVAEKDFESVIRNYARNEYDLIILAGSQFEEVVSSVAGDYPGVDFCILNGRAEVGKNVFSVYPKEEEASHLAGIIAGNMTQTGVMGTIAGYPNEAMEELLNQYEQDVRQIAKERNIHHPEVLRAYANSWEDEGLGKEIANQMINKGADILFIYANKVGNGCIEAAKEHGVKVIGFSENQNDIAPGTVIASIRFDFGKIYSWILDHYLEGRLNGNKAYGIGIEEEIFLPVFTDEVPWKIQQAVKEAME